MRLFCRKCDKEIKDFEIKQEECGHISYVDLIVFCHGTQDYIRFHRTKSFNTSDYGDLYFFEGDEPKKEWDVEKCHELFNAMLRRFHDEKNISGWLVGKDAELKKLKEENRELKNRIAKLRESCFFSTYDDPLGAGHVRQKYERLREENRELKNKISDFQGERTQFDWHIGDLKRVGFEYKGQIETLKEENEKLKEELKECNHNNSLFTWTKTKPTETGWYYYKEEERQITWKVYRVFPIGQYISPSEVCEVKEVGFTVLIGVGTFKPVEQMNGEWAGPIPEPVEPEKIKVKWRRYQVADRTYTESYPVIEDCCKRWEGAKLKVYDKFKPVVTPGQGGRELKSYTAWPSFCPECGKKL